jgi:hypothetical protein
LSPTFEQAEEINAAYVAYDRHPLNETVAVEC